MPCSCGSTRSGHLLDLVVMTAFWMDTASAGRPCVCHTAFSASVRHAVLRVWVVAVVGVVRPLHGAAEILQTLLLEAVQDEVSVLLGEGPGVADEGRRHQHVTHQHALVPLQRVDVERPTLVLAAQRVDEALRQVELGLALLHGRDGRFLLRGRGVELVLQRLKLRFQVGHLGSHGRQCGVGFFQLRAASKALDGRILLVALPRQQGRVETQRLQERLGRRVHLTTFFPSELKGQLPDGVEGVGEEALNHCADRLVAKVVHGAEELLGDAAERCRRPGLEEVDDGAVDERRKAQTARAEVLAHGREGQHHMEVASHAVPEELEASLPGGRDPGLLNLVGHGVHDAVLVLRGQQARDDARRQEIVQVHQEPLVGDLGIGQQEHDTVVVLQRGLVHHGFEVVAEVVESVGTRDGNLLQRQVAEERGEARETLLAAAADANQQGVAILELQDAHDTRHVLQGVVEQHQRRVRHAGERRHRLYLVILAVVALLGKVAENQGRRPIALHRVELRHALVGEVLLALRLRADVVAREVFGGHQTVAVHALAFVQPQMHKLAGFGVEHRRRRHQQTLEDVAQVSDVELVVEVLRRFAEALRHLRVKAQRRLDHVVLKALDVFGEVLQVPAQQRLVDGQQRHGARQPDGERGEPALQTRVDGETSRSGIEARDYLRVDDASQRELLHVVHVLSRPRRLYATTEARASCLENLPNELCLSRACETRQHHWRLGADQTLEPEGDGAGLRRLHGHVAHLHGGAVKDAGLDERALAPRHELCRLRVVPVVEDGVTVRDLHLVAELRAPAIAEDLLEVVPGIRRGQRGAEGPDGAEYEVGGEDVSLQRALLVFPLGHGDRQHLQ
eukprot:scaffold1741_cov262-Pinguiococcus_pyrenoidosus.AAC.6